MSVQPVTMDHGFNPCPTVAVPLSLRRLYGSHMYLIVRLDNTLSEAEANAIQDGMAINAGSAYSPRAVNRELRVIEQSLHAQNCLSWWQPSVAMLSMACSLHRPMIRAACTTSISMRWAPP